MKTIDDSLEWHDENELVRRLDVVEAVLNLADTIDDVVDVIMSVPTYKVKMTSIPTAMGSDSISTRAEQTEPQTDGYMTAEQAEDYRKMLDKAEHKVYGNIEDEPQTERSSE